MKFENFVLLVEVVSVCPFKTVNIIEVQNIIKIPFDIIKYDNNRNNKFWMATSHIYRKHFTIINNFVNTSVTLNWDILTSITFFNKNFSHDSIAFVFVLFFFCLFTCFLQQLPIWWKTFGVNESLWISFLWVSFLGRDELFDITWLTWSLETLFF